MKIRDGLKFQSGAPCTAKEVVANFNIFRGPEGRAERGVLAADDDHPPGAATPS